MSSTQALTLHTVEGEARVLDTDLAARLGMAIPANIRKDLIAPNRAELEGYGVLGSLPITSGAKGGRPGRAFYLNEEQALLLVMFSRTAKAAEVRREIIAVYQAWRHGELERPPSQRSVNTPIFEGPSLERELCRSATQLCHTP